MARWITRSDFLTADSILDMLLHRFPGEMRRAVGDDRAPERGCPQPRVSFYPIH